MDSFLKKSEFELTLSEKQHESKGSKAIKQSSNQPDFSNTGILTDSLAHSKNSQETRSIDKEILTSSDQSGVAQSVVSLEQPNPVEKLITVSNECSHVTQAHRASEKTVLSDHSESEQRENTQQLENSSSSSSSSPYHSLKSLHSLQADPADSANIALERDRFLKFSKKNTDTFGSLLPAAISATFSDYSLSLNKCTSNQIDSKNINSQVSFHFRNIT